MGMTVEELSQSDPVRLGLDKVGHGGQATVYRLPADMRVKGCDRLVYKRYAPSAVLRERRTAIRVSLEQLIASYDDLGSLPHGIKLKRDVDAHAAWPLAVVEAADGSLGVVERLVDARFLGGPDAGRAECLEMWIRDESTAHLIDEAGLNRLTDGGRRRAALQILAYYAMLHGLGFVIGDISFSNIMLFVPESGQAERVNVGFIEVDTYRHVRRAGGMPQGTSPTFTVPEADTWLERSEHAESESERRYAQAKSLLQTQASDVYKAALVVLRLFSDEERFPTSIRCVRGDHHRERLRRVWSETAIRALEDALEDDPAARPTMDDLYWAFCTGRPVRNRCGATTPASGSDVALLVVDGQTMRQDGVVVRDLCPSAPGGTQCIILMTEQDRTTVVCPAAPLASIMRWPIRRFQPSGGSASEPTNTTGNGTETASEMWTARALIDDPDARIDVYAYADLHSVPGLEQAIDQTAGTRIMPRTTIQPKTAASAVTNTAAGIAATSASAADTNKGTDATTGGSPAGSPLDDLDFDAFLEQILQDSANGETTSEDSVTTNASATPDPIPAPKTAPASVPGKAPRKKTAKGKSANANPAATSASATAATKPSATKSNSKSAAPIPEAVRKRRNTYILMALASAVCLGCILYVMLAAVMPDLPAFQTLPFGMDEYTIRDMAEGLCSPVGAILLMMTVLSLLILPKTARQGTDENAVAMSSAALFIGQLGTVYANDTGESWERWTSTIVAGLALLSLTVYVGESGAQLTPFREPADRDPKPSGYGWVSPILLVVTLVEWHIPIAVGQFISTAFGISSGTLTLRNSADLGGNGVTIQDVLYDPDYMGLWCTGALVIGALWLLARRRVAKPVAWILCITGLIVLTFSSPAAPAIYWAIPDAAKPLVNALLNTSLIL
ncbi:hypothetical protein [uncultured Bifidobacterium sp.]|uniref:hypothetical protein n=1 Tax=uncultured Bifidobacterium sp. TaxID=165187 RepID=UPI002597DACD|nr:hypothetical protein [uncultured Bifidobacterium sp.]